MLAGLGIGLLNASLLWWLPAVAVPVLIHLWRRRRREVVDWGAMMFLDDGSEGANRRSPRIQDRLLLAARMAPLGLLVLALARPYRSDIGGEASPGDDSASGAISRPLTRGRTFVIAVDRSASMDNRRDGTTPRALAARWARRFVAAIGPGDAAAIIDAGARGRSRIAPPTRDKASLLRALSDSDMETTGGGPSDLASALDEAFRILDATPSGLSDVILLTDGRRFPWRPDEALRWDLAREAHRRLGGNAPKVWAVSYGESARTGQEDAAGLGPLDLGRSPALADRPIVVSTVVANAGPRPITPLGRLVVDGRPHGPPAGVGPIAPGGRAPLSFTTTIAGPGVHLVGIRLDSDDATPGDDEAEGLVEVIDRIPVLIVDGMPGKGPLGGQADFLRIALDPRTTNRPGEDASGTSPFRTRVVPIDRFKAGLLDVAKDAPRVLILADVAELDAETAAAVDRFIAAGGGLMVLLGDAARSAFFEGRDWFPGKMDGTISTTPTRLDPMSFSGLATGRFAMNGDSGAPLAQVEVFRHRSLKPDAKAVVSARLASGAAWCVERATGKGRVLVISTALDGRATTLPINPDFVPLAHEWILSLSRGPSVAVAKALQSGEPWIVPLDPPPPLDVKTLPLRVPGGKARTAPVVRQESSGGAAATAEVRVDDTDAPGVYRLGLDTPSYAIVGRDARESDPTLLSDGDRARLKSGWPLAFASDDPGLIGRILGEARPVGGSRDASRVEFWRLLILTALATLCVESWLARRIRLS